MGDISVKLGGEDRRLKAAREYEVIYTAEAQKIAQAITSGYAEHDEDSIREMHIRAEQESQKQEKYRLKRSEIVNGKVVPTIDPISVIPAFVFQAVKSSAVESDDIFYEYWSFDKEQSEKIINNQTYNGYRVFQIFYKKNGISKKIINVEYKSITYDEFKTLSFMAADLAESENLVKTLILKWGIMPLVGDRLQTIQGTKKIAKAMKKIAE